MTTRILYVLDHLVAGGIERQTTALITGLDRTRFEPRVLCLYGERAGDSLHFAPYLRAADVPLHILDLTYSPQSKLIAYLNIIRAAWRWHPHIIHTINYHSSIFIGWARPFLPPGTQVIVSVRAENTPKQIRNQRLSWRVARSIICNSPHLVTELTEQASISPDKITMIPNGLQVERFAHLANPQLRQEIAPGADYVLLMVTRISARKVPQLLPQALGMLKAQGRLPGNLRAVIVGEREDAQTQQAVDQAVSQHQLEQIVTQYPQTDHIQDYYHAADVTLLLSLWGEGLPNVVLESLAVGRPVIISEAANRAGIVEHGVTGWIVRTGDVAHLAETLDRVLHLPVDELQRMQMDCRAVAGQYTMEHMILNHQLIYDKDS